MPRYLPVSTKSSTVAIAVCDRCKLKKQYSELRADGNSPGLRVCPDCWDSKDPWRLPARKTETITLRMPRPDEELDITLFIQWQNNPGFIVDWINSSFDFVNWKQ